jgi:hypothetical protein
MRILLAAAATLCATAALSQGYNRTDLVRALCHKDGCDEFAITQNTVIREIPDGILRKVTIDMFKASHAGRAAAASETSYTYCSKRHPALIAQRPGKVVALMIAPFNPDPPEMVRKAQNFTAIYFAACHGVEQGRASVASRMAVAESLGYPRVVETVRSMPLSRPEEIVTMYEPKPIEQKPVAAIPRLAPEAYVRPESAPVFSPDEDDDELPPMPPRGVPIPYSAPKPY